MFQIWDPPASATWDISWYIQRPNNSCLDSPRLGWSKLVVVAVPISSRSAADQKGRKARPQQVLCNFSKDWDREEWLQKRFEATQFRFERRTLWGVIMQTFGLFGSILLPASSSRGIRRFVCSEFCSLQPVVLLDFWSVFWIAYVATFCNYSRYRVRTRYVTYIRIEVGEQPICMKFLPKSQQFVAQAWRVRGPAWHQSRLVPSAWDYGDPWEGGASLRITDGWQRF